MVLFWHAAVSHNLNGNHGNGTMGLHCSTLTFLSLQLLPFESIFWDFPQRQNLTFKKPDMVAFLQRTLSDVGGSLKFFFDI